MQNLPPPEPAEPNPVPVPNPGLGLLCPNPPNPPNDMVAVRILCSDYSHSFKVCLADSKLEYRGIAEATRSRFNDEEEKQGRDATNNGDGKSGYESERKNGLTNSIREEKEGD